MVDTISPHIAMVASPGMGHLIPILELAKRLISTHHFTVTIFLARVESYVPSTFESDLLCPSSLPPSHLLQVTPLPAALPLLDPSANVLQQLCSMMRSTLPHLYSALSQSPSPPTALIVDLFSTEALHIADAFGMKKYVFCTSNAWFLALTLHVPTLNEEIKPNEELTIPGCKPVRYEDLPDAILERGTPAYDECVRVGSEMASSDGILVNTWEDLDPCSIDALKTSMTSIHPVGPVTRPSQSNTNELLGSSSSKEVLAWMDEQPQESVLYVSFGSGGTLSAQQTIELAYGLELSQQRFVWVVRPPSGAADGLEETDASRIVPHEFMERTRNVGKLVSTWAPQTDFLAHPAVGAFLTHAGWNSVLEGLVNGLPLIVWPLYAEQNMNATLLCEEVKVAVRLEALPTKELITRVEIGRMVRKLMVDQEGRPYKDRAKELQRSAKQALSHGGTSSNSLAQVARECELHALER